MREAIEERERVAFHQGMSPAFYQGKMGGRVPGQEPFVAKADQPVGNCSLVQPDILGLELFATAPVADRDIQEHTFAGQDIE
jgi:hypothetical protein